MVKTLFLFLFSNRVDTYINAISYAYDEMEIKAVRLVYVKGTKIGLKDDTQASAVFTEIWSRLQELAEKTNGIYKQINERLLDRQLIPIEYSSLKISLGRLFKLHGGPRNCIIDLTSASKVASIDVFTVCFALGIKSIHTFELGLPFDPKSPDKFLYHALSKSEYSYTCLSITPPVRSSQSSLVRKSSLLWYVGCVALVVMVVSLYILVNLGPNSSFVQFLNLTAAVIGLASPALALLEQRREH
ncbi:MAG: hypothetical protein AAF821_19400 [Cyanobacteria bacterium P01_D01_bin.156]